MWERVQPPAPHCFCFSVGAGLPAMQTPRCISDTQSMPSQASQLPHLIEFSFQNQVGCQAASVLLLPLRSATRPPCFAFDFDLRRPTLQSLREGTPSPSEVPSGVARAFWLLLGRPPAWGLA